MSTMTIPYTSPPAEYWITCPTCHGAGLVTAGMCSHCQGRGSVRWYPLGSAAPSPDTPPTRAEFDALRKRIEALEQQYALKINITFAPPMTDDAESGEP